VDAIFKFLSSNKEALLVVIGCITVTLSLFTLLFGSGFLVAFFKSIAAYLQQRFRPRIPPLYTFPFEVIKPNSDVLKAVFGGARDNPLAYMHEAWNNRGFALMKSGDYENAIQSFGTLLYADAFYNKACCFAPWGKVDEAVENLRRAIELNPNLCWERAKIEADFDGVRNDVRFQALLAADVYRMKRISRAADV
jgi:tetratricopeptide (TPR) repeat protein